MPNVTKKFAYSRAWPALLDKLGMEMEPLLNSAGLPEQLFTPGHAVAAHHFFTFWTTVEKACDEQDFPLMTRATETLAALR